MNVESARTSQHRPTPAWWFLWLLIPSGICQGFSTVALPYWLTQQGVPLQTVSTIVALWLLPYSCQPLLALVGDLGPRRRSWFLASGLAAGGTLYVALQALAQQKLPLLSACMFALATSCAMADNALIALAATTVRPQERGLSSGCLSAAQLTWGGVLGWLMVTLRDRVGSSLGHGPALQAIAVGLCIALAAAALLSLAIDEPCHAPLPLGPRLRLLFADVSRVLRSTPGWTSLIICLAPMGTTAAVPLFGALAPEYHVGASSVGVIIGIGVGAANAAGAMLAGIAADRIGARRTCLAGALSLGLCGLGMALSPTLPSVFVAWCLAYGVCAGLVFAGFYALVFDLLGPTSGVNTTVGVFMGATNLSAFYVTLLNGRLYHAAGRVGLLLGDAGCNWVGLLLVVTLLRALDLRLRPRVESRTS